MLENLAFVALLNLTVSSKPIFDYEYKTTTSYGIVESVSGTQFYERSKSQIGISTYYCFYTFGCGGLTLDSGYTTPKQKKEPEINWLPEIKLFQQERFLVTLTPTFKFGGRTKSEACLDSVGRRFHCYYGTQQNSPLFFASFEQISNAMQSRKIELTNIEVTATWQF